MSELAGPKKGIRVSYGRAAVVFDCPGCVGSFYYKAPNDPDGAAPCGGLFFSEPLRVGTSSVPVFDLDRHLRKLLAVETADSFPAAIAVRIDALDEGQRGVLSTALSGFSDGFRADVVGFSVSSETAVSSSVDARPLPACIRSALADRGITGISFPEGNSVAWYVDPLRIMMHALTMAVMV